MGDTQPGRFRSSLQVGSVRLTGLDHIVIYAADLDRTINFYTTVLGMTHVVFDDEYHALRFGEQKINLHDALVKLRLTDCRSTCATEAPGGTVWAEMLKNRRLLWASHSSSDSRRLTSSMTARSYAVCSWPPSSQGAS